MWAEHVAKNTARNRDDIAEEVKHHFSDAEFVELTAVCGLFGQSNRFQDSMRLPIEDPHEVDKIRTSVHTDPAKLKNYLERILEHWPCSFPQLPAPTPALDAIALPCGDSRPCRVPLEHANESAADAAVFLSAARGLLGASYNAMKVWAHTPHVAKMFLPFFFAFERSGVGSILPASLRLMIMLQTHHEHDARYLLAHHTVLGSMAGITGAQLAALSRKDAAKCPEFSRSERAAIAWAVLVAHNTAKRNDSVFDELTKYFSSAEIVEMTALCAITSNADLMYNALRVPVEPATEIKISYSAVTANPEGLKKYIQQVVDNWPKKWPQIDAGPVIRQHVANTAG